MRELEASRAVFLAAIGKLSPAQWAYKPAPDRWSAAEYSCGENLDQVQSMAPASPSLSAILALAPMIGSPMRSASSSPAMTSSGVGTSIGRVRASASAS